MAYIECIIRALGLGIEYIRRALFSLNKQVILIYYIYSRLLHVYEERLHSFQQLFWRASIAHRTRKQVEETNRRTYDWFFCSALKFSFAFFLPPISYCHFRIAQNFSQIRYGKIWKLVLDSISFQCICKHTGKSCGTRSVLSSVHHAYLMFYCIH